MALTAAQLCLSSFRAIFGVLQKNEVPQTQFQSSWQLYIRTKTEIAKKCCQINIQLVNCVTFKTAYSEYKLQIRVRLSLQYTHS